jgi:hypothetical protein
LIKVFCGAVTPRMGSVLMSCVLARVAPCSGPSGTLRAGCVFAVTKKHAETLALMFDQTFAHVEFAVLLARDMLRASSAFVREPRYLAFAKEHRQLLK